MSYLDKGVMDRVAVGINLIIWGISILSLFTEKSCDKDV